MKRLEVIDKSERSKCWCCNKTTRAKCKTCKGTGIFIRKFYHLIYADSKGNKLCFGVDSIK